MKDEAVTSRAISHSRSPGSRSPRLRSSLGRPLGTLVGCCALLAALGLTQTEAADAFTLERPVITSHGVTERHACFRGGFESDGASTVYDPAPCKLQKPRPQALPVHRGGRVSIRTPEAAERLKVVVRSRRGTSTFGAHRVEMSDRRWRFRMPRFRNRSKLRFTIFYSDGQTSWSLPLKRHRH
jgi:hypothetical protein